MRTSMTMLLATCFSSLAMNVFAADSSIRFHAGPEAAKRDAKAQNLPIVLYCDRTGPDGETTTPQEFQEIVKSKGFYKDFRDSSVERRQVRSRLVSKAVFFRQLIPANADSFGGELLMKHDLETFPGALIFDLNGDELTLRGIVAAKGKGFDEFVKSLEEVLDRKPNSDKAK